MDKTGTISCTGLVVLLGLVFCCLSAPATAEETGAVLKGEVAYSDFLHFDFDRNGTTDKVQMWVEFDIRAPQGKKGEPGYRPGQGTMRRYLKDVKTGKAVIGYNMYQLVADNPLGQDVDVEDVSLDGKSMRFTVGDLRYTVTDGGPGYENDTIIIDNGVTKYSLFLYDGDLVITGKQ